MCTVRPQLPLVHFIEVSVPSVSLPALFSPFPAFPKYNISKKNNIEILSRPTCLPVPLSVVVVAHDVDEVEALVHGWDVVGDVDGGGGGADGRGQEETRSAGVEGGAEVLEWDFLTVAFVENFIFVRYFLFGK